VFTSALQCSPKHSTAPFTQTLPAYVLANHNGFKAQRPRNVYSLSLELNQMLQAANPCPREAR